MFLFSASLFFYIWINPEGKQFCTAFKQLKKLSLHGIFVEFDLLWTIVLLEAAPTVAIFDIEVLLFVCFLNFPFNEGDLFINQICFKPSCFVRL